MDVKEKTKKRKEKKRNKNSESECVCLYVFLFIYIYIYIYIYFNDKIADIKEEFNILIGSRLRIINLYVSDISNFR